MRNHTKLWLAKCATTIAALTTLTTGNLFAMPTGEGDSWGYANVVVRIGGVHEFIRTFYADTTYEIIADGDEDARDIDLYVLDSSGQVIQSDTRASKEARIVFRPSQTGTYTVHLKLVSARRDAMCHVLFLNRDGGWDAFISNLTTAAHKHLAFADTLESMGHTPRLVRIFALVMNPGDEKTMSVTGLSAQQQSLR